MAETTQVMFSHQDLVKLMLKSQNIDSGHWILAANFGFSAMNAGQVDGGSDISPAALIMVQKLGMQRVDAPTPFSVDATKLDD